MTAKLQYIIEELDKLPLEELAKIADALEKKLNLAKTMRLLNEERKSL